MAQCGCCLVSIGIPHAGECFAHGGQAGRVRDEVFVGLFGAGKTCVVAGDSHVGVPEQVFFGLVDGEVVGVEGVKYRACVLHCYQSPCGGN